MDGPNGFLFTGYGAVFDVQADCSLPGPAALVAIYSDPPQCHRRGPTFVLVPLVVSLWLKLDPSKKSSNTFIKSEL